MWGSGKKRSKVGKFIDKQGYSQEDLCAASKISRNTISKICNDPDYIPSRSTMKKLLNAIRKIKPAAEVKDFWNVKDYWDI
ncbi:helix-turn-helix transcriptional regulator [Metabacillus sp. FJAT-52054]|uniref:Helix-turn-helix transcriptional regulator n=1 Tax=Metabacillus sediminis TaxID=3117746 RepID=A0ABZ2NNH7_9BACI